METYSPDIKTPVGKTVVDLLLGEPVKRYIGPGTYEGHVPYSGEDLRRADVNKKSSLKNDLGMDSLDVVEFGLGLEKVFGLPDISDAEYRAFKTVGDVVRYVESHAPKKAR